MVNQLIGRNGTLTITPPGFFTINGGINFNGIDFSQFIGGTDGGQLTINADYISFGSGRVNGPVTFNGGSGFTASNGGVGPGSSGGIFTVNTTDFIAVRSPIEATTGAEPDGVSFSGAGGTVSLSSSSSVVNVSSRIQVSSNDLGPNPNNTVPSQRRSASGGQITLHSGLTTGLGINLLQGSELLSLLSSSAPGTPGSIILRSSGGDIFASGTITADRGLIEILQQGNANGRVNIDNATLTAETISAFSDGDLSIGVNGAVTLNAPTLNLFAGHDLTINGLNSGAAADVPNPAISSDGNVLLQSLNAMSLTGNTQIVRYNAGRSSGLDIVLNSGGILTATGYLILETRGAAIDQGGNVRMSLGPGNNSVGGVFDLVVRPNGHIGTGGNITASIAGDLSVSGTMTAGVFNEGGTIDNGGNVSLSIGGTLSTNNQVYLVVRNTPRDGAGGSLGSVPVINLAAGNISLTGGGLYAFVDNRLGTIAGSGGEQGTVSVHSNGSIISQGEIDVLGSVTAGGDITAEFLSATNVSTPGNIVASAIKRFSFPEAFTGVRGPLSDDLHTISGGTIFAGSIQFGGAPATSTDKPGNGGNLTLNSGAMTFGGNGPNHIAGISDLDGGDGSSAFGGGNGGTFTVNTSGDINVGVPISATTGRIDPAAAASGLGGAITLHSASGQIIVNSQIQVSSNDIPTQNQTPPSATRRSASGGNITMSSGITAGSAVSLGQNSKFLSLLNSAAPGPGGTISIATAGGDIQTQGQIEADRGAITISNLNAALGSSSAASINVNGGVLTSEILSMSSRGNLNFNLTNRGDLNANTVTLDAAYDINFANPVEILKNGDHSSADVTFNAGRDLSLNSSVFIYQSARGQSSGADVSLSAGSNISAGSYIDLIADSTGITSGGNVSLAAGQDLNTAGETYLSTSGGDQGITGGNVDLHVGRDLSAAELHLDADFSGPGALVNNGANLRVYVGRDLNAVGTQQGVDLSILNTRGQVSTGDNIVASIIGAVSANRIRVEIDNRQGGSIGTGGNIEFHVGGQLYSSASDARFVLSNGEIYYSPTQTLLPGGTITDGGNITVSAGSIQIGATNTVPSLTLFVDNRGGTITNGGIARLDVSGAIVVNNRMRVLGAVTASSVTALQLSSSVVTTLPIGGITYGNINVGGGGITPFTYDDGEQFTGVHTLSAAAVSSLGGINFNGQDARTFNGVQVSPNSGGQLTVNADSLGFEATPGSAPPPGTIFSNVTLNGGTGGGFYTNGTAIGGGDGGTLTINTSGAITANLDIEATTGLQPASNQPSGNGGSVALNSTSGTVTVNKRIEVSSNQTGTSTRRRSAKGGSVALKSGKSSGVAVNLGNSSQLLSLLDASAPGPGGKITILATGANSSVHVNGKLQADRGVVDIRHTGDAGSVNLGTGSGSAMDVRADVVKAAALGTNGALNIGSGSISADTMLQLYAPGSNGTVNFLANVSLSGAGTKIIAGNTVNIFNGVNVNIGGTNPASVYTNNPNYSGFGGNGTRTGTFIGAGASNPQPLNSAPAIGPPPGG